MNNDRIKVTIKTLSPIHTGSGQELIQNVDFVHFRDRNVIAVIDIKKILRNALKGDTNKLISVLETINKNGDLLKCLRDNFGVKDPESIASSVLPVHKTAQKSFFTNIIKQHNKTGFNEPLIAGSSLKGAIRTALLSELIRQKPDFAKEEHNTLNRRRSFDATSIQSHYLANKSTRLNPNQDLLRFLRVGDFVFNETEVHKLNIVNWYENKKEWAIKHQQSSLLECIPAGAIANGFIQSPSHLIKQVISIGYLPQDYFKALNLTNLCNTINKHTQRLLGKEIQFWEDEDNPPAIGEALESLQDIDDRFGALAANECILRLGGGSGWDFMTGGWAKSMPYFKTLKKALRPKHPVHFEFPKTRKLLTNDAPLGFIKLTFNNI